MSRAPLCLHCGESAVKAKGREVYPRSPHLADYNFWRCRGCKAHVGCHPPLHRNNYAVWLALGRPANSATRRARSEVHKVLDPIWKEARATKKRRVALRVAVYGYLSLRMKLARSKTHVGMFTYTQCYEALKILRGRTQEDIRTLLNDEIDKAEQIKKKTRRGNKPRRG